jgi:hypothetical protein
MKGRIVGHGDKARYYIDGKEVTKAEFDVAFPPKPIGDGAGLIAWKRPLRSRALAVHPKQVQQANARSERMGLGVHYEPDGTAVLPTRNIRKNLMKAEAMHDNEGGYGDG